MPIVFKLLGKVIEVKLEHPPNAPSPILVTPFPIVALVSLVHPKNAFRPMLVTESGIAMEESCIIVPKGKGELDELAKADAPIFVTLLGMVTEFRLRQP